MIKKLTALAFAFFTCSAALGGTPSAPSSKFCAVNEPYGTPVSSGTVHLCRPAFAVGFDTIAKIPSWVSYVLTPKNSLGCFPRVSSFKQDPALPRSSSATSAMYAGSGFDIGHMANSADLRWSEQAEVDSEVFSNAAPQTPNLNRGEWSTLEQQVRAWSVSRNSALLVYVGPIYKTSVARLKNSNVVIPTAFYKILVDTKTLEVLSFIYPNNQNVKGELSNFISSIDHIQGATNVIFKLPKGASGSKSVWPITEKTVRLKKAAACSL